MVMQEALEKVEDEQVGIGPRQQEAAQTPAIRAAEMRLGNAVHEPPVEHGRGDGVAGLGFQPVPGMPPPVLNDTAVEGDPLLEIEFLEPLEVGVRLIEI